MADLKISQLTALATFADDDLLAIVDTSATETKKVEWGAMKTALASVFWKLDGNTVGSEKFIGTIDNFAFPVRVNNTEVWSWETNGEIHRSGNLWSRATSVGQGLTTWGESAGGTSSTASESTMIGFRAGAAVSGNGFTAIGAYALYVTTEPSNTALGSYAGRNHTTGHSCTYLGFSAGYPAGAGDNVTGSYSMAIGTYSLIGGSFDNVLSIHGVGTAANQIVIGGATNINNAAFCYYTDIYLGRGVTNSAPATFTYHSTDASGTDTNGANTIRVVSRATGSGTSGDMIWQYAPSGSTGTTLTTATTGMTFKGTTGQLQFSTIGVIFNPYGVSAGNTGELRFAELAAGGTNYVGFKAADAIAASVTWTLPATDSTGTQALVSNGSGVLSWASIGGGSGTVTSFSAGDLSPLFTTSEATATTTPALSFSLNTQNANKVFAGPATGADAAPTFRVLVAADIPSLSGTYLTVDGATTGATSQAQVFTNGIKTPAIDDNTAGLIEISFSNLVYHQFTDTALQVRSGSIVAPSLSFLSDASSGIYLKGAGAEIGVSVNSALVGGFDATGLFAGLAGTLTGTLKFNGATSGTVTVQSAAAAGTWTLTLPTTDGNSGEFLQTNGSGVTTWAVPAGTGANTALSNLAAVAINTTLLPGSNDGAALGSGTLSFSDLFLASGAVVNFANGNSVITHSSAVLTVSTGDLRVTTAGTNATSVATLDGTQTLTNKSIVATQLTGTAYTMAVNNTSGTAAYTLTNYRNDVIADFDGTFTWNSTPPSTIVSQKYVMSRIGNLVILTISVLYTSTGTTNTTCIVTFPSTAPAPAVLAASGDAASEYMYPICGARVEANQTANPSAIRGGIRRNSGNSAFEILLIFGSTSALQLQVTVIYFTA